MCCLALKLSDFVELIIVNKLLLPHEGQQKLKLLSLLSLPGKQHIWILLSSTENKELNLVESSLHLHVQRQYVLGFWAKREARHIYYKNKLKDAGYLVQSTATPWRHHIC